MFDRWRDGCLVGLYISREQPSTYVCKSVCSGCIAVSMEGKYIMKPTGKTVQIDM